MKIKEIRLEKFKRFTDLTITGIPQTARLVILVGPNGCGKSSLFDAFKAWHLGKGYNNIADGDYCKKDQTERRPSVDLVKLTFFDNINNWSQKQIRQIFYFRTAYRNSPKITINSLSKVPSPLDTVDSKMMNQNDDTVNSNYQKLMSETISSLYDVANDEKSVKALRDELLNKIREPLNRLFPELLLTEIGVVTDKAEFYFSKGCIERYGYEKLSGGEKAAFDLLLDFIVKLEYYKDTIFCIDEPETHIHTSLQAKLLEELFNLIPEQSQLWIATHSFGMLRQARKLKELYPDNVVFLNFDGFDFDDTVMIEPSECDTVLWDKMLEITLGDYSPFITPENIVFCEGTNRGRKRKDFDARCYATIFGHIYPSTMFYSLGSCTDIEEKKALIDFVKNLSPSSNAIRVIDRDERSSEEIIDLESEGIRVLKRRHLECYLLDDAVLEKWCRVNKKNDQIPSILQIKQDKLNASIARGNAPDDIKSAANDICTEGKKLLGITACGNSGEMIMRDTLAKLITPDMAIYQELENELFGEREGT